MTHLPYVAASYALGVLVPAGFALAAYLRLGAARRRLAAIDPRVRARGEGGARPSTRGGS
jgi:HAMP domain-containing protein